jgi:hypothetical protein
MPSSLDNTAVAWTVPTASPPHPSKNRAWYSDSLASDGPVLLAGQDPALTLGVLLDALGRRI